jgi:hypothetical protein
VVFFQKLRHQADVCARLAEDCDDQHLAERFKAMAKDLLAKAVEAEESPNRAVTRLIAL